MSKAKRAGPCDSGKLSYILFKPIDTPDIMGIMDLTDQQRDFVSTLDSIHENHDGVWESEQEIADRIFGKFNAWLNSQPQSITESLPFPSSVREYHDNIEMIRQAAQTKGIVNNPHLSW